MQNLVFHDRRPLRQPLVLLAFSGGNDAGQAATTAVRFLAEQMGATPYASIDPEEFYDFTVARPTVRLMPEAQRAVEWTSVDFCAATVAGDERDYVFGWGPEPHLKWKTFCGSVLELARGSNAPMVVTLGGFLAEVLYDNPVPVSGFASSPELIAEWNVNTTRYEGPTGIVGVLGEQLRQAGMPHVSLWAALPHYIAAMPNPRGSLALLLRLAEALRVRVDLTPMQRAAAKFEEGIEEAIAADPKLSGYVGDLRKRSRAN